MKVILDIVSGPGSGQNFSLGDDQVLRVGRTNEADFVLSVARSLSSLHFALECRHGTCQLRDLHSKNGTLLNGERVSEAYLRDGDKIGAGGVTFAVKIEGVSPGIPYAPIVNTISVADLPVSKTSRLETSATAVSSASSSEDKSPTLMGQPPTQAGPVTKRAMPIGAGPRQFYVELYEEHLEEASALYEQRLSYLDDPELTWLDVGEFEDRLEAHLDALVVGEDLALEVCETHAEEGDFGELFAVVCVFCRQKQWELLVKILDALDVEDSERMRVVRDALTFELPVEWQSQLLDYLANGNGKFSSIVTYMVGFRRLKENTTVLNGFVKNHDDESSDAVWAIGRFVGKREALSVLEPCLEHENVAIRSAAALSLLRVGIPTIVPRLCEAARTSDWALLPLALGADSSLVSLLQERSNQQNPTEDYLFALGLAGDPWGVPLLFKQLQNADLAESAAIALNLITGADLEEDVWIPEEIDEDELFEEELQKWKETGERPMRPDGKPFGESVVRLSQNPEDWEKWWKSNHAQFRSGARFRRGQPYSPSALLETLETEKSIRRVRQWAYEELTIRYGLEIAFETDMLVFQQKQALSKIAQWVKTNESRFQNGGWYFAGKPLGKDKDRR